VRATGRGHRVVLLARDARQDVMPASFAGASAEILRGIRCVNPSNTRVPFIASWKR
jgi:hypothetical protein